MSRQDILQEALELPPDERAALAHDLWDSLHAEETDEDLAQEMLDELEMHEA